MISKTRLNYLISLQKKKTREEEKLYVIEGDKLVKEFLEAKVPVKILVAKPEFLNSLPLISKKSVEEVIQATYDELKKISTLKTPHNALAVVRMEEKNPDPANIKGGISLAIDCVQDPGNMGTIIRSAAWFGVRDIYCSPDCVDQYNPKVIQASMGAILHVNVFYTDLTELLKRAAAMKIKVFGTMLEGDSIYSHNLSGAGIILLGNESKGISESLLPYITDRIMIPKMTKEESGIDSLNVGMAASVILSEFTRSRGRSI